ncbi:MAG: DUF4276 family protein [Candidatus Competibacteraceae bacterium]|nr:DUF4276 family protein [Candidatus Competibacteraceae bacterium]
MTRIVFFLEEPSAREMLNGLLPKILPEGYQPQYIVFEGKQDLEKRLPIRLRAWQQPDTIFVVLRDQDSGNCKTIKDGLVATCIKAGQPNTLVRIACHELESFYLGDLVAVAEAIGPENLGRQQSNAKYRDPDRLTNPAQELKMIAPKYQKLSGSRAIGPRMNLDANYSHSFNVFVSGVRKLVGIERQRHP